MEDFNYPAYGIRIISSNISIEPIHHSTNLSKFHFLISKDKSRNYNGNETTYMNIIPLADKEFIEFSNWKLIQIWFPGNWYGQWGACEMEDVYGERTSIALGTGQYWFKENSKLLLEKSLNSIDAFAKENPFVLYYDFFEYNNDPYFPWLKDWSFNSPSKRMPILIDELGNKPSDGKITLKGLDILTKWTNDYIKRYYDILEKLEEHKDDRFDCFRERLDRTFSEVIDKYFHLEIKDFIKS